MADVKQLLHRLEHSEFKADVLKYFAENDGNPIGFLQTFAEQLRELIDCDQVIYRDLEKTLVMRNRPGMDQEWAIPIEICQDCPHFPATSELYDEGVVEMYDGKEGFRGVPIHPDCPAKSLLTSIVYLDGKAAGYLTIHYLQNHHHFTDLERRTLDDFTKLISLSLSRYTNRVRNAEMQAQREAEYRHAQFRTEALEYFARNDGNPIGFLETFAEQLRELLDCDQVIYRDLEKTVVMRNRPGMDQEWAIPIEICRDCPHFPATSELYDEGVVEMYDGKVGFRGVPTHPDCPAKSLLTSIVYLDGKTAGYLTVHFLQDYHHFTDLERRTLDDFTWVLSISLDRYTARLRSAEIERLEWEKREAEAANAAKTRFLSSMSHDIRTPMNAISGMADIVLRHTDEPEKVAEGLQSIKVSCSQLISLVNDVLDISASDSGQLALHPAECDMVVAFRRYQELFRSQMKAKELTLEVRVHDMESPLVLADDTRLEQVFVNLLDNAVKYTPQGGHILLEGYQERDGNGVLQTVGVVQDNGIGMSEEFMKQMWDTFNRGTDTRINKIPGAGLGLSIVRILVDLMDGNIEVESVPERGTTFRIHLPLEPAWKRATVQNSDEALRGMLLLVAEDNELNWEIMQALLLDRGIRSVRADDGAACLRQFVKAPKGTYGAILMDLQMPVMNGIETAKAVRASCHPDAKAIPILAVTANTSAEDQKRCREAGMNAHISKPIDMEKLLEALRNYT